MGRGAGSLYVHKNHISGQALPAASWQQRSSQSTRLCCHMLSFVQEEARLPRRDQHVNRIKSSGLRSLENCFLLWVLHAGFYLKQIPEFSWTWIFQSRKMVGFLGIKPRFTWPGTQWAGASSAHGSLRAVMLTWWLRTKEARRGCLQGLKGHAGNRQCHRTRPYQSEQSPASPGIRLEPRSPVSECRLSNNMHWSSVLPCPSATQTFWLLPNSPGGVSGKEPACHCRRLKKQGFNLWVGKMPWRSTWQPILVFLPWESHGWRSLAGIVHGVPKESDTAEGLTLSLSSASVVSDSATPWTVTRQAPLSMGFSRHEYWSGLPFPSPGDLPNPGIEPGSPTWQLLQILYHLSHQGSPWGRKESDTTEGT